MLVSLNVIFFGYFMHMSHGVNEKTCLSASPNSLANQMCTSFFCCFTITTLSNFCGLDQIIGKDNVFSKLKNNLSTLCWTVFLLSFCSLSFNGNYSTVLPSWNFKSFTYNTFRLHGFRVCLLSYYIKNNSWFKNYKLLLLFRLSLGLILPP